MKLVKFSLIPPIVAISALFVSLCACGATQRYVSKDGSYGADVEGAKCYTTLQAAVAAAGKGDTIWVQDGFECTPKDGYAAYDANGFATISITNAASLTIRGKTGNWETGPVIRGSSELGVRCIYAPRKNPTNTNIDGLTLIGLRLEDGYVKDSNGGGLYTSDRKNIVVTNCFIANCGARYGGGAWGTYITMYQSVVSNCFVLSSGYGAGTVNLTAIDTTYIKNTGAAFYVTGNNNKTALRCKMIDNSSTGCYSNPNDSYKATVRDCVFKSNAGGGVYGKADVSNCVFISNSAEKGAGVAAYLKSSTLLPQSVVCTDCVFSNNTATSMGSVGWYGKFINCRMEHNAVTGTTGTGTRLGQGTLYGSSAYNSLIANNTSMRKGGGIYVVGACELVNCTVVSNASVNGATIDGDGAAGSTLTLVNTIFAKNSATAPDIATSATTCFFDSDGDPKLVKAGKEFAFWPKPNSPCIGTGTVLEWMSDETDARSKDLAGLPRLTDGKVNIGCYEGIAPMPGLLLLLR